MKKKPENCDSCGKELNIILPHYVGMKNGEKQFKYLCKMCHDAFEKNKEHGEKITERRNLIEAKIKVLRAELKELDQEDKDLFDLYQQVCKAMTNIDYDLAEREGMALV